MAVPQGFKPSLSPSQVRDYKRLYDQQPEKFDDQTVQSLEHHAQYYKLPFAENNNSFMGKVGDVMKQVGWGFGEGFTTFEVPGQEAPTDDAEAIARNIGHLAGFVGYVPTFKATGLMASALRGLKGRSIPMWAASKAQQQVGKLYNNAIGKAVNARKDASNTAMKFFQNDTVKDLASGAFHLGVASAVSSWRHGVDEMMSSFIHGAQTGAVFRLIGNKVSSGTGSEYADKAVRGIAASVYSGLPSTMRGDTTPMQIYNYLLGAYFGVNEMPIHQRQAKAHIAKMTALKQKGFVESFMGDPSRVEGWENLPDGARKIAIKMAGKEFETEQEVGRGIHQALSELGRGASQKEIDAKVKEIKKSIVYTGEGEPLIPTKKTKKVKEEPAKPSFISTVKEILSGGQVGPDEAGLAAGKELGLITSGTAPPGWKRKGGADRKLLESYGLKEGEEDPGTYPKRTMKNVDDSDGTIAFRWKDSPGTDKTIGYSHTGKWEVGTGSSDKGYKPILVLNNTKNTPENIKAIRDFITRNNIVKLNIAGHADARAFAPTKELLKAALTPEVAKPMKAEESFVQAEEQLRDSNRTVDDVDPQNTTEFLSGTALTFVSNPKYMQKHLKGKSNKQNKAIISDISDAWLDAIAKGKSNGTNPGEYIIDHIRSKYPKYDMTDSSRNFWLSTGIRRLHDSPVQMIGVQTEKGKVSSVEFLPLDENGASTNKAGNRKFLAQERKRIDDVYQKDFNKKFPDGDVPVYSYSVLDHIVIKTRRGNFQEKSLPDYKKYLESFYKRKLDEKKITYKEMEAKVQEDYNKEMSRISKKLNSDGLYYFGGRGDAKRMYFVRYHPESMKPIENIRQDIKSMGLKENKSLERDRNAFYNRNKSTMSRVESNEIFDRAFISNVHYAMRMNGFKEYKITDYKKIMDGDKYVTTGKGYNKRAQIWFTNGYSADPQAVSLAIKQAKGKDDLIYIDDANGNKVAHFKVKIVEDNGEKNFQAQENTPSSKYEEGSDGHIAGRTDAILGLNKSGGLPTEGNANKSFIVSPHKDHGALLGKYMIHNMSGKVQDLLAKNDLHFIIPITSAKQRGERKFGRIEVNKNNELYFTSNAKDYYIPVKDFKNILSEKTDRDFSSDKHIPKQIFTNQTPFLYYNKDGLPKELQNKDAYYKRVQDIMSDMYHDTIGERIRGTDKYNLMVKGNKNRKIRKKDIDDILENLDKVGINNLLVAAKEPGNELFANRLYDKLQSINRDITDRARSEGEMTSEESSRDMLEMTDYVSVQKRIQELSGESLAGHLFKWSKEHRNRVMHNYVVDAMTRPIMKNSAKARIRPYDKGLELSEGTKRLEKEDDIFFLDLGYKDKMVDGRGLGLRNTTLDNHWIEYNKIKDTNVKAVDSYQKLFRSVIVRVPMDAMSGARVLNFAGFTGIDGLGILMHGRKVRALGGADLDGDTSFIFFGGRAESGEGVGFKESWKDMYKWSEKEFTDKKGREEDSKKRWESEFVQGGNEHVSKDPLLTFSPATRMLASELSYGGRKELGVVVTQTSYLKSLHASIFARPDKEITVKGAGPVKNGKKTDIVIQAKDDTLNDFNSMSKATIGYASDPMDFAGLNISKNNNLFLRQTDALFNYRIVDSNNPNKIYESNNKRISAEYRRRGPFRAIQEASQAIYGRNWAADRQWEMWEVRDKIDLIRRGNTRIDRDDRNTFLTRLTTDLDGIDWSDRALNRVNRDNWIKIHDIYAGYKNKHKWLKEVLGRKKYGLAVANKDYVLWVLNNDLHTVNGMKRELTESTWNEKLLDIPLKKNQKDPFRRYKDEFYNENKKTRSWRRWVLNDIVSKADDFVIQNFSDMASVNRLLQSGKKLEPGRAKEIYTFVDYIKKQSYLNSLLRQKAPPLDVKTGLREQPSRAMTQMEVDAWIRDLKAGKEIDGKRLKNQAEVDFFEDAMLSTLWYNNIKTGLSKLGFASPEISNKSIHSFLNEYSKLFESSIAPGETELLDKAMEGLKKIETPRDIIDAEGTSVKGEILDSLSIDKRGQKYLNDLAPFQWKKKKKVNIDELPKEHQSIFHGLMDHLTNYVPHWTLKDLNQFMRGHLGKDLNAADLADLRYLNNWFKSTRDGTWWQRMMRPVKDNFAKLSPTHYYMFPRAIGEDLMRYELGRFDQIRQYKSLKHGAVIGPVTRPTNNIDAFQKTMHTMSEQALQMYEKEIEKFDNELRPYYEGLEKGDLFYKFAIAEREIKYANNMVKTDNEYKATQKVYRDNYKKIHDKIDWNNAQNEIFEVNIENPKTKKVEVKRMSGREIVNKIDKIKTKWVMKTGDWTFGSPRSFDGAKPQQTGFDLEYKVIVDKSGKPDSKAMVAKFIKEFNTAMTKGEILDLTKLGNDGVRELTLEQFASTWQLTDPKLKHKIVREARVSRTNRINPEHFYPHMPISNPRIAKEHAHKMIEEISKDPTLTKQQKDNMIVAQMLRMKRSTGDFMPTTDLDNFNVHMERALQALKEGKLEQSDSFRWLTDNSRIGSQHSRTAHLPGYDVSPEVFKIYMKQVIDGMYKHAAQIKLRDDLYKWKAGVEKKFNLNKDEDTKEWMENWTDFYNLYIQQGMGQPSHIPDRVLENPNMKLKGTLFSWWSDKNVKKKLDKIYDRFNIKPEDRMLPKELRGVDYQDLAKWGNIEAKFELASLLAHPRSMVANLYGGTANTLISTGWTNYKNARSISYLKANVNPKWETLKDVNKWVHKLGVVEEFLIGEFGKNPKFASLRWKNFFEEAQLKLKKDPDMADTSMWSLAKKHGISRGVFNAAAWFMRRAERTLRRDSFVAHYLQARNNFEGAIRRYDDPALIEFAKRGVKSTQFLYSAPFRPMFAATSLGKVMTRFQLWAWNSVRFRKDVLKEAHLRGWKEGTPEFERFKRLATADAFMMAMSGIFMYSLFEAALPAPYNWLQDTADWLYGDEKERDRAFFGAWPAKVAPLQMITPPILRLGPPMFKGFYEGDWEKFASYYIWTMFPFGRAMRDVIGEGGIVENPARTIEKVTGIPYQQFSKWYKDKPDSEKLGPRGVIDIDIKKIKEKYSKEEEGEQGK